MGGVVDRQATAARDSHPIVSAPALDKVLVLDFGSQYTQLIARRIREQRVYSEIWPCTESIVKIRDFGAKAIVLSGGPSSVHEEGSPSVDPGVFELGLPVLGICYGMQLTCHLLGGKVVRSDKHEYGRATVERIVDDELFHGIELDTLDVWMSHGDSVDSLPDGFHLIGKSDSCPYVAVANTDRRIWGLQFHPEVVHTPEGSELIANFIFRIAGVHANWTMGSFIEREIAEIRAKVGDDHVICGLSGGVDSSVVAALLDKALGDKLIPVFVNNGVLRQGEAEAVQTVFRDRLGLNLQYVDATDEFLDALAGVTDPEKKRKIIGKVFIDVFDRAAKKVGASAKWLAQGTLYPDVIESVSFKGPSAVIKSHHNVGGLPERMNLSLIEPLRELFKDEVRVLGTELGLPDDVVKRQPFPGPGLAIRVLGEVTRERLKVLRAADHIVTSEIRAAGLYDVIWQSFCALLPVKSVGVMGDARTYEETCAIRAVTSVDGMTADWAHIPYEVLAKMSNRIINEVRGINRVVYDISSKPPATIEW